MPFATFAATSGAASLRIAAKPSSRFGNTSRRNRASEPPTNAQASPSFVGISPDDTPVTELMAPSTVRVSASADQETAARLLTDRNLLAIPVVATVQSVLGVYGRRYDLVAELETPDEGEAG